MKHTVEESFSSSNQNDYRPALDTISDRIAKGLIEKLDKTIEYYMPMEAKKLLGECNESGDMSPLSKHLAVVKGNRLNITVYTFKKAPFLKVWKPHFNIEQYGSTVIMRGEQKFEGVTWDPDNIGVCYL